MLNDSIHVFYMYFSVASRHGRYRSLGGGARADAPPTFETTAGSRDVGTRRGLAHRKEQKNNSPLGGGGKRLPQLRTRLLW